jgi:hypothetical protein
VRDLTAAADSETTSWGSAAVTLELFDLGGENASSAVGVGDGAVADGVAGRWEATSDAVLSITELSHGSWLTTGSGDAEGAGSGDGGRRGTGREGEGGKCVSHGGPK